MSLFKSIAAAALLAAGVSTAQAAVTVSCSSSAVENCAAAADGVAPPLGGFWQTDTAFWEGIGESVTLDLGGVQTLGSLFLSLDNNDSYLVESSVDGNTWSVLGNVAASDGMVQPFPGGMDFFDSTFGSTFYVPGLVFAPRSAAFVRVSATGGDTFYSVGEVLVGIAAVPEPATWALMLAGAAGLVARRRRSA